MAKRNLDPIEAEQIVEEFVTRFGDKSKLLPDIKDINFDADLSKDQVAFINNPNKRKAILGSRRSGKSTVSTYYMVKTAYSTPNTNVLFVGITRQSAKEIIWDNISAINERYKLGAEPNLTSQTWTFANGSHIYVSGADSEREIRKYLGKGYSLIVVDECGDFGPHLETMIKKILMPTLLDNDGTLVMIGTPGLICSGFWYSITTFKIPSWHVVKWTLANNPNLPQWRGKRNYKDLIPKVLQQIRDENGFDEQTPEYRRQYLGEWIEGGISLVYSNFKYDVNVVEQLPDIEDYNHIIGIDFGVTDPCAIVVGAYSFNDPNLYIVDTFKASDLPPEDFANIIYQYFTGYKNSQLIADGNGIGKAYIAQLQKQHNLPLQIAEKKDKLGFIELLNDDFRLGRIKILNTQYDLLRELTGYQWKDSNLKILPTVAEDHLLDALLYLWRNSLHFKGKTPKGKPKQGTQEYEDELVEAELERVANMGKNKKSVFHR